jgi:hypothetical protein
MMSKVLPVGSEHLGHNLQGPGSRGYYLDSNRVGPGRPVVVGSADRACRTRHVVLVGMRDVETVIERITACLRMEASAGTISAAS